MVGWLAVFTRPKALQRLLDGWRFLQRIPFGVIERLS
jgi:hypothetical protein